VARVSRNMWLGAALVGSVVSVSVLAHHSPAQFDQPNVRLMYLATVFPLLAAITRIDGLPDFGGQSLVAVDLMALVWISPMLVYDLARSGRLHRAYVIWFALWCR
jgi:hypothetical protein